MLACYGSSGSARSTQHLGQHCGFPVVSRWDGCAMLLSCLDMDIGVASATGLAELDNKQEQLLNIWARYIHQF